MASEKVPRRAPAEAERRRDPERTKERILQAAVDEFGKYGYSGARVSRIASGAGVNAQLISYHFDGKAGLYQAVLRRWQGITDTVPRPGLTVDEIAAGYVRINAENRSYSKLLAWESLGDAPAPNELPDDNADEDPRAVFLKHTVADFRKRQAVGELPGDVDPAHLLLALFAAASAPDLIPQVVTRIFGIDADSEDFRAEYAEQLGAIVRHLIHGRE